jgi:hypothetical protein
MDEIICANQECGVVVLAGDQFCGACGTPVAEESRPEDFTTWGPTRFDNLRGRTSTNRAFNGDETTSPPPTGGGVIGSMGTIPPDEPAGLPFFSHEPPRLRGPLTNVTRLLCTAAYLDRGFASRVILNLLMTRKAVAPSVNFDVGPVLQHCLRARRLILVRDVVLVLIIVIGLAITLLPTLDVLLIAFALGYALPNAGHRRGGFGRRLVFLLATVAAGVLAVLFTAFLVLASVVSPNFSGMVSTASVVTRLAGLVGTFVVMVGLLAATEFAYLRTTARAKGGDVQLPDESHRAMSRITRHRMAVVEGAQWGNITLHSGWFPFIGSGAQTKAHWSIATPLRTRAVNGQGRGESVHIDPVDLHQFIGEQLRALNDPELPENERIAALTVSDRLVGTGLISVGNPLFDPLLKTPYSHASRDAVQALMRHPQASLRYYQQVSVNDESPVVMSRGRKVIDDVDQEVAVSAFVYAAVEGRMLYLQFVLTALPPINAAYRARQLRYATSVSRTLIYALRRLFSLIISAVPAIYEAFRLWRRERQMERRYLSAEVGDYGARISVRELGTASSFGRYIQVLDVEKYNMIFSEALLNAVTEYLVKKDIDISAFTGIAQNIINNINNNSGNVYGDLNQQAGNDNSANKPPNSGSGS